MPLYRYKAVASSGEAQEGEMEGLAPAVVVERLQGMGLIPIRVEESVTARVGPGDRFSLFRRNTISQADIAVFTQEIATLLRADLPLDRTLGILINLASTPQVAQLLTQVRDDVRAGASLSAAMEAQSGVFSRFYLNMIRAGEAGGALGAVLARLSEFMERAKELRETVKSALIYPAILVGVAALSIIVLLGWVVPQFTQMFEESGKALPVPTQVVIAAGTAVQHYWWAIILALVALYAWFAQQLRQPRTRYQWDRRFLAWPLLGDLLAKLESARFARTLGTLIGNGVPLLTALSITKDTLSNTVMAESLATVAAQLKEGQGLGAPLMESGHFPKLAVHMVMVGEETGKLQEMLMRIADVYDREVHNAVKRLLALMEPVLILGLGLVIGGIIMSVLVAILSVNDLAL